MKLAIVTGGSKGLGLALCKAFVDQDFTVIDLSRSAPHPYSVKTDLGQPDQATNDLTRAIHTIDNRSVDELVVISNAGDVGPIGSPITVPWQTLIRSLNVNFVSAVSLINALVLKFHETKARKVIANVTSGVASNAYHGLALYGAAKAGMEQYIKGLATEQSAYRQPFLPISIDPGVVDTGMQEQLRGALQSDLPGVAGFIDLKNRGLLTPATITAAAILKIVRSPFLQGGSRYHVRDVLPTDH